MTVNVSNDRRGVLYFATVFLVALGLFLPFRSLNFDVNAVVEASYVEAGGALLINPNHLLYRIIARVFYDLLGSTGNWSGSALQVLQPLTAVLSALGVATAFLAMLAATNSTSWALAGTAGMAVSWGYWRFSTDAFYITAAMPFCALAVLCVLRGRRSLHRAGVLALVAGVASAISILWWQANVLLLVIVCAGWMILQPRTATAYKSVRLTLITLASSLGLVGAVYLALAVAASDIRSPSGMLAWLSGYQGGGTRLWGQWSVTRVPALVHSMVSSILPVWDGMGLRATLRGDLAASSLVSLTASIFVLGLGLLVVGSVPRIWRGCTERALEAGWLMGGYLLYLVFVLWWDPFEPKWLVVPSFFLWMTVALVCSTRTGKLPVVLMWSTVVFLCAANFAEAIWPRHTDPGEYRELAECVSGHMKPQDLFMATDWNWVGYLSYFHGRNAFSLVKQAIPGDAEATLRVITDQVARTGEAGGVVLLLSPKDQSPEYALWFESATGVPYQALLQLDTVPLFVCDTRQFAAIRSTP